MLFYGTRSMDAPPVYSPLGYPDPVFFGCHYLYPLYGGGVGGRATLLRVCFLLHLARLSLDPWQAAPTVSGKRQPLSKDPVYLPALRIIRSFHRRPAFPCMDAALPGNVCGCNLAAVC